MKIYLAREKAEKVLQNDPVEGKHITKSVVADREYFDLLVSEEFGAYS